MGQTVARIQPVELIPFIYPDRALTQAYDPAPNLTILRGTVLGQITAAVNDVDTVTMTGTGGTWALTIQNNNGTYTVSNLAYNISTAALQTAVQALPNIGSGNATVSGTAGTSYVITGAGALAGYPLGIVTVDPTNGGVTPLTGGTVTVVHTTTNAVAGTVKAYASGNSDGSQIPLGIARKDFTTDQNGNITLGTGTSFGLAQGHTNTIDVYLSGYFREAELTGLDANAVTKFLGREFNLADGTKMLMIPGP
jgi:hypothetical protein